MAAQDDAEILSLPVVDVSSSNAQTARDVLDAASQYGFVFIKNYQSYLTSEDINAMFDLSRNFFQSPVQVKAGCSINSSKSGKNRGWLGVHGETLDPGNQKRGDFKEAFNIGEYSASGKAQQPLPAPLAPHEARIGHLADQCHALCNQILQLVATALEIPPEHGGKDWFAQHHDRSRGPSGSVLRLLYYPSPSPSAAREPARIRAGAHTDYGTLTLLFQLPHGPPGLELFTAHNTWAPVPALPDTILVNIGDLLSCWTEGLLRSTVHRVVFPGAEGEGEAKERYSIAYFCHPADETRLLGVPSPVVRGFVAGRGERGAAGGGADDGVLTAREHLNNRLAATYGINQGGTVE